MPAGGSTLGWTRRQRMPTETRRQRCASKRSYATWAEAEDAAVRLLEDIRDGKLRNPKNGQ